MSAFTSELTEIADVVLPSATFAQKQGTYTNLERRVQLMNPALGATGDEGTDWRTLSQLARRMGARGFDHTGVEAVFDEINDLVDIYGGITYSRLGGGGIQWPCLAADMSGTARLYGDGENQGRRAQLSKMALPDVPRHSDPQFPYLLAHGRVLHDADRAMEIGMEKNRAVIQRDEVIEIHAADAGAIGVDEGDWAEVVSVRGSMQGVVQLTSPLQGLVSTTSLFGQLMTDLDRSRASDPMLEVDDLPLLPVRIEKIEPVLAD